jgi:hypothetical protein
MFFRSIIICCILLAPVAKATTIVTIAHGDWEDPSIWSNHLVPSSPDSVIIYHYVVLNQNVILNSPTVLFIDASGTICGEYLLETSCGSSFTNYGHMYLNQIKTRAGTNYNVIECKNYINISGCPPSGSGYFNSIPPNGTVKVWPPVLCKTYDTHWEGGTQIGLIELENNTLSIYPNPIHKDESLTIVTLSHSKIRLVDSMGQEIETKLFENKTEINLNSLPKGLYFIEIEINGKKQIKKIVKTD